MNYFLELYLMNELNTNTLTTSDLEEKQKATFAHANLVMEVISKTHGQFFSELPDRMHSIVNENASVKVKRANIRILALDINSRVMPETACRKGCNHCCSIPVIITSHEAESISKKIGRPYNPNPELNFTPREIIRENSLENYIDSHPNVGPCTFQSEDGQCSIYEHRPIQCITHHSLDKTDFFCRPDIPADMTVVPSINTHFIHEHYSSLDLDFIVSDIRQFFPKT